MVTLYGIRSCDTVRKARRWLDEHRIEYRYHDLRGDGLTPALLEEWIRELGWENLLNRRGTTWRQLPPAQRSHLDADTAKAIMLQHPAVIRRPVVALGTVHSLGFSPARFATLFS
ncbi:MAG: ArsC family reductase [Gammaproteobacteria bacterium]|jgi:Spx/MgsR family transcriptional regulator